MVAHQAPLSMRLSRQENWSGLLLPFPGDLLDPRVAPTSPASPVLAGGFFTPGTSWEAPVCQLGILKYKSTLSTFHLKGGGKSINFHFPLLSFAYLNAKEGYCAKHHGVTSK